MKALILLYAKTSAGYLLVVFLVEILINWLILIVFAVLFNDFELIPILALPIILAFPKIVFELWLIVVLYNFFLVNDMNRIRRLKNSRLYSLAFTSFIAFLIVIYGGRSLLFFIFFFLCYFFSCFVASRVCVDTE